MNLTESPKSWLKIFLNFILIFPLLYVPYIVSIIYKYMVDDLFFCNIGKISNLLI